MGVLFVSRFWIGLSQPNSQIGFLIVRRDCILRFVSICWASGCQSPGFKVVGTNATAEVKKNKRIGNDKRDPDPLYGIDRPVTILRKEGYFLCFAPPLKFT